MHATEITLPSLRELVRNGGYISWVGSARTNYVLVLVRAESSDKGSFYELDLREHAALSTGVLVNLNESDEGCTTHPGPMWRGSGWLNSVRLASVLGVNINGRCIPGIDASPHERREVCTMGYDIEVSMKHTVNGSFPSHSSDITSLALWCTCGDVAAWTTVQHKQVPGLRYCTSSARLVADSLGYICTHRPHWLVGYNCYRFDNCVMAYHSENALQHLFRPVAGGTKGAVVYSMYIDIPGVNNVDLYLYLDKRLRANYEALSLGDVARHHGVGSKGSLPTLHTADTVYSLVKYNITDSMLTSKLWSATGVENQMYGLCLVTCSPVVDCVRYVSGTMVSCALSSYCMSRGKTLNWSRCSMSMPYEGGMVIDPMRRTFRDVTVVDFSSMYPTIMMDVGISPENIELLSHCTDVHGDRVESFDDRSTTMCVKGRKVRYSRDEECVSREMLGKTTELRGVYKITDPDYALAFKLLSNSLYGAFGYPSSPMYSPRAAASVTLMGRLAITLAHVTFTGLGLTVIYGDTDSCMLAPGRHTKRHFRGSMHAHVTVALDIFHLIISFTPMPSMRMSREAAYKSILVVDKKHYAYMDLKGGVHIKGLSSVRKDRLGVCRIMCSKISTAVLSCKDLRKLRLVVSDMLDVCASAILAGTLDMQLVSKEVRFEGVTCYRYTNSQGEDVNVPVTSTDRHIRVDYDKLKVYTSLEREVDKLCVPAGIGSMYSMLRNM